MDLRSWVTIIGVGSIFIAGCASDKTPQTPAPTSPPLTEFEKAKDPPINAKTRFAAGQLAESQGDLTLAKAQYKKAIELDRNYVEAIYRLGIVQTTTKEYAKALETWTQYVTITHGSATAYSNLGFCQELTGNAAAAEGSYKLGIEREPNNEPCRVNYGLMLARHGRPNEGLLQLQTVLSAAKAHYDLASVYQTMGQKKEARAEYAKALEMDPNLNDARSKLASLDTEAR